MHVTNSRRFSGGTTPVCQKPVFCLFFCKSVVVIFNFVDGQNRRGQNDDAHDSVLDPTGHGLTGSSALQILYMNIDLM